MMDNARTLKILNEIIRPLCDRFAGLNADLTAVAHMGQVQGWTETFPPADSDEIIPDSDAGGRRGITGRELALIVSAVGAYAQFSQTPLAKGLPSPADVALIAAVNPR
jgi:hypothetical protein